jgi:mannose-6-phosphate isomerase-like protein (cupin superfamily)
MSITPLLKAEEAVRWTHDEAPVARIPGFWMFDPANPQEPTPEEMEELIAYLLEFPQVEMPVRHHFAPGVYLREIFMPADTFVIGHLHKTEHLNTIRQGRCQVWMRGRTHEVKAGDVIRSIGGVQKVLYIHEDTYWSTIHPIAGMPELDEHGMAGPDAIRALEDTLIQRSPASIRKEIYL